jgi:hypothetical protein
MSDERWFVTDGHSQTGPLSLEALRQELARPGRGFERRIWREGMSEWIAPDLVPELAAPPPPPGRPQPREPMFMLGTKDPKWFLVGEVKLAVMVVATFGLYQLYWFYKQWHRVRDAGESVAPVPRAIFSVVFCYSLFRRIMDSTHAAGVKAGIPPWVLAVGFILPSLTWKLDGSASFLGFLAFVPLVAAQHVASAVAVAQGSTDDRNTRLTLPNWAGLVVGSGLLLILAISARPTSKAYLSSVAAAMNRTLPKTLDKETVLAEAIGLDGVLVYRYRMPNRSADEMDANAFGQRLRPALLKGVCASDARRCSIAA